MPHIRLSPLTYLLRLPPPYPPAAVFPGIA
jgi:hypothetical protein